MKWMPVFVLITASVVSAADLDTAARYASAGQRLIPHYAAGGAWTTRVRVVNPTTVAQRFRLNAYNTQGNPQTLRFNGSGGASFEGTISPLGLSDVTLTSSDGQLKTGMMTLDFIDDPRLKLPTTVFFRTSSPYNTEGAVSWDSSSGLTSTYIQYDNTGSTTTGIALADLAPVTGLGNPRVEMTCYTEGGSQIGTITALPNGSQQAAFDLATRLNGTRGNRGICTFTFRTDAFAPVDWSVAALALQFEGVNFLPLK